VSSAAAACTFSVLVNHENGANTSIVRAHGSRGSFVSRWRIKADASDLRVIGGDDLGTSVKLWNTGTNAYETYNTARPMPTYANNVIADYNTPDPSRNGFGRFCSADMAEPSAYRFGNLGTDARLYMNGEETGAEGRAYAHIVTGPNMNQSWQLPHLGKFSWENSIASPFAQQKTVVIGTDDSTPGQVYMYVGNKTASGNDIERAGLTNGNLFGVRVSGLPTEVRGSAASGRFDLYNHGDVSNTTGATLNSSGNTNNVTNFLRPEDGQFDPRAGFENDFYFVTTDRYANATTDGRSRLYRMRFDDITNPEAGGEISMLLEGGLNGPQMMDNMTIDSFGRVLIQEDIGGQDALSKVWLYDLSSGGLAEIAQHDPSRFGIGAPGFLTRDEESSGIIDAKDVLGEGWFLLNVQAHYGIPGELVEGGQMLAMYVDPAVIPAPATLGLVGLAGVFAGRRRR
jgi:hypothetical protein